jgi:hypothetical protein
MKWGRVIGRRWGIDGEGRITRARLHWLHELRYSLATWILGDLALVHRAHIKSSGQRGIQLEGREGVPLVIENNIFETLPDEEG